MSTNLRALIRYRTIHQCLNRTYKQWTWETLAEACGEAMREYIHTDQPNPSRRSIMYDINVMRHGKLGFYAPIVYDRNSKSYYYSEPGFSIYNIPLTKDDVDELRHALVILKQFQGFKQVQGIEEFVTRLEHNLSLVTDRPSNIIHFDQPHDPAGIQWLSPLYNAIFKKLPKKISYHPFHQETAFETLISPLLLKEYNNRWFLIAWNHEHQRIHNYPLDRILSLSSTIEIVYHQIPEFNPNHYFKNVVGVSFYEEQSNPEIVQLWINAQQAPYIKTKPLHASQTIIHTNESGTLFQFKLIPNYELESKILALGEAAEVIQPTSLRTKIISRIESLARRYANLKDEL